jgi:hypothetical protein
MGFLNLLPGSFSVTVKAKDLGAGAAEENPIFRNGFGADLKLVGAALVSKAGLTGNGAAHMVLSLINKGTDGTGSTSLASKAFDTPGDDDVAAYGSGELDLAAAEADRLIPDGAVVSLDKAVVGAGMALADDLIELRFQFAG